MTLTLLQGVGNSLNLSTCNLHKIMNLDFIEIKPKLFPIYYLDEIFDLLILTNRSARFDQNQSCVGNFFLVFPLSPLMCLSTYENVEIH